MAIKDFMFLRMEDAQIAPVNMQLFFRLALVLLIKYRLMMEKTSVETTTLVRLFMAGKRNVQE